MAVDFDISTYFTPSFTPGFGATVGWKKPWALAYLNLGAPADTLPGIHQYIPTQRFEDGLRADVDSIEITKTLDQGSWCHIEMVTHSDRDIFEISDNEGTGHMLPRMKFPYRSWEVNLKAKDDSSFPDPALFRGMLTGVSIEQLSDVVIANQQDGLWRIKLDLESFDSFCLNKDVGAPLWHHRANSTTDTYHWAFSPQDSITFDDIITRIVAWMNMGRPTTDFPITYSYTPKAASPYTLNIFDPVPYALTGTLTFTNGNTAVTGTNTLFTSEISVGQLIAPDANITGDDRLDITKWGKVSSITDDTNIVLTANYGGTTRADAASSENRNTLPLIEVKDRSTWSVLRDVLTYMGGLEGAGNKYIPSCSNTGVIDVVAGGFDKTAAIDEDFRSTWGAQDNTSFTIPGGSVNDFNLIYVPFTAVNDAEYWFQCILYESDGIGGWTQIFAYPSTGYEYIPFDANNTHGGRYIKVPTQPAGTYKWDAQVVTAGTFDVNTTGGLVYSPQTYNFLKSPVKIKYGDIRTFAVTQGRCSQFGTYHSTLNKVGCKDGGTIAGGGYNKCPDTQGCYPDPSVAVPESVNAKYGILGIAADYNGISAQNSEDTLCRLNSKSIYTCFQNVDSSIREPLETIIIFNDGFTTDLVGSYLQVYSPELDEMVTVRCNEQVHKLYGKRVSTVLKAFRV